MKENSDESNKTEISKRVEGIIVEHIFGYNPININPNKSFEEMGMDSLDTHEIAYMIEGKFGIKIPDETIPKLDSLKKYEDYISKTQETSNNFDRTKISSKLEGILVNHIFEQDPRKVMPNQSFEEMGMDVLDIHEVAYTVEQKFGIRIPDETIPKLDSVRKYENYISNYIKDNR